MSFTVNYSDSLSKLADFMYFKERFIQHLDFADTSRYNIKWKDKQGLLKNCGTFVEFQGDKITRANFCRERFCPLCQYRRSLKMYNEILNKLNALENQYSCIHVVLTVPNCTEDELKSVIDNLISQSTKLYKKYKGWKGVGRFLEVTYNENTDTFHPHLHNIVLVKPSYFKSRYYVSVSRLKEDWSKLHNTCNLQVDISAKGEDTSLIAEVAKYCVKPFDAYVFDNHFHEVLKLYDILKGRRLVQFFGVLHNMDIDLDEDDTTTDTESRFPFIWQPGKHCYELLVI